LVVLLDSDHLSILQRQSQPEYDRLTTRLAQLPPDDVATAIVSFQEQVRGWLSYINLARTPEAVVRAYAELESMWRSFCKMNVVSFGQDAQDRFESLRRQRIRIATLDLRITGIALMTDSTLLSRNLRDFRKVPRLKVEDWTK